MLIVIKGGGDIASGIALRLRRCGFCVVMTELPAPTSIRRTVCFSEAVRLGRCQVEDVEGVLAETPQRALVISGFGVVPVLVDPDCRCLEVLRPDAVVDARLAKVNLGTKLSDAPVVIGVGPGFTAGKDCHAVVETQRSHDLGRPLYQGSASPNTGIPGDVGGYTVERLLRTPAAGTFHALKSIGDRVQAGDAAALVDGQTVVCAVSGVLRGLLPDGQTVPAGMKCGDVDPRGQVRYCRTVSDKALSVAGGVLEAVLHLTRG